jgi:regulator of RNase E activity RraA
MPVVAAQIVEYHRDLRLVGVYAQLQVALIVGGASVFPGDVAVIADPVAV